MARYKKQLSIYVKESWIEQINFFARKSEEDVSTYIQRAISFQLIHDKKLYEKEKKEKSAAALTAENLIDLPEEEFNKLVNEIAKAASDRKKIEIAKTRWLEEDQ